MKKKSLNDWTRKELEALPHRKSWSEDVICNSLVILPLRRKHDSGYACMDFVAVMDDNPMVRLSGCSDVVHIDGIGGYGERTNRIGMGLPSVLPIRAWSIDCLKNGLLRLFVSNGNGWNHIKCGASLSSFEIYSVPSPQSRAV